MNVMKNEKGHEIYESVTTKYCQGDIYYLDNPYICEKSDLSRIETGYLAGKRRVLIISNYDLNKSSSYRWVIPISTYHPDSTYVDDKKILFKDIAGNVYVLNLNELHSRRAQEFKNDNGGRYICTLSENFMKVILGKITSFIYSNQNQDIKIGPEIIDSSNDVIIENDLNEESQKSDITSPIEKFNNRILKKNEIDEKSMYREKLSSLKFGSRSIFSTWPLEKQIEIIKSVKGANNKELEILARKNFVSISTMNRIRKMAIENF